jgi:type III secretion protein J
MNTCVPLLLFLRGAAALLLALTLGACSKSVLYSKLDEREANEMVSVLFQAELGAEKRSPDGKTWSVVVAPSDFAPAVDALKTAGYPREKFHSLCDVFKKDGFISSSIEERARMICGLQQELARTVALIDGVVDARVHISVPERDPLSEKSRPASASVAIKHRSNVNLSALTSDIKAIVVNGVEGLPYENVTVKLFVAETATIRRIERNTGWFVQDSAIYLSLLAGLIAISVIVLGFWRFKDSLRTVVQKVRRPPARSKKLPVKPAAAKSSV